MTVEEVKAKIFHWLCTRYHDPGQGNEYIDKDIVRDAINIPEEVFEKALNEGILLNPGNIYDSNNHFHLRLSYAYASLHELNKGLIRLSELIEEISY